MNEWVLDQIIVQSNIAEASQSLGYQYGQMGAFGIVLQSGDFKLTTE